MSNKRNNMWSIERGLHEPTEGQKRDPEMNNTVGKMIHQRKTTHRYHRQDNKRNIERYHKSNEQTHTDTGTNESNATPPRA